MPTLNVTIVQAALHWHDAAANRGMFEEMIGALESPTDLIVLPEMFTTGFTMDAPGQYEPMDGPTLPWLRSTAEQAQAAVCGSVIIEDDGDYYNRFLCAMPDGELVQYDKRHLFRLAGEHEHYAAGNTLTTMTINGIRVRPMVCYDLRFPVWSRRSTEDDYDALIYVANWPSPRHNAWATLLRARAIENQCYVIGVNRTGTDGNDMPYDGGSAIIDYLGNDLVDLGDAVGTATAALDRDKLVKFRGKFPFAVDADRFDVTV